MVHIARREDEKLLLRLYIVSGAPNSISARANLSRILEDLDDARYVLEIVDCIAEPRRALEDGVLVTPTLLKLAPEPTRTIVGTLAEQERVVEALGLMPLTPHHHSNGGASRA